MRHSMPRKPMFLSESTTAEAFLVLLDQRP